MIKVCLNRVMSNSHWHTRFLSVMLHYLVAIISYHNPILFNMASIPRCVKRGVFNLRTMNF